MFTEIKAAFLRSRATLIEDAAGAAVLMLALFAFLHLPSQL